jgi:hypothetical protein
MAKTMLEKVQAKARAIRKRHPNKGNAAVMSEAWSQARGGKVSGVHKGKRKKSKPARVGTKPKYKVIHEVRQISGVSYKGGTVKISGAVELERTKEQLKYQLGQQAGWLDVAISSAKTARERKALQKKKRQVIAELNRIK